MATDLRETECLRKAASNTFVLKTSWISVEYSMQSERTYFAFVRQSPKRNRAYNSNRKLVNHVLATLSAIEPGGKADPIDLSSFISNLRNVNKIRATLYNFIN
jgi:hypothetical protein